MTTGSQACNEHMMSKMSVRLDFDSGKDKEKEEDGGKRGVQSSVCYVCCIGDVSLSVGNMELVTNVTETQTNKSPCADTQTFAAKSRHSLP